MEKTLFQQQTERLRIYFRHGDAQRVCKSVNVSLTTLYNAWKRQSYEDMTAAERAAYKAFVERCQVNKDADKAYLQQLKKIAEV